MYVCSGKLGAVRVLTSLLGFSRPSSINFNMGVVRDIVSFIIQLNLALSVVDGKGPTNGHDHLIKIS